MIPVLDHREVDARDLAARRGATTVSVCVPARDEEATIGEVVSAVRRALVDDVGLVDEIVVVDDHSVDDTAAVAEAAGATVVAAERVRPDVATGPGKGQALWRGLAASRGDLVVFCDADVTDFGPHFVAGLLAPLLADPDVSFVKGTYGRPLVEGVGGGRVTELVARPVLSLVAPELATLGQPLGGEYAGRRELLESLPFPVGYGVEIALLLDVVARLGPGAIAQVDLGTRHHRNRTLDQLGPQALEILHVVWRRVDPASAPATAALVRPTGPEVPVPVAELPPLAAG